MNAPLRAIVADDSAVYRAVLVKTLAKLGGIEIIGQATNGAEAVELVKQLDPDFLTLDLNMPVLDGIGALRVLRAAKFAGEVIVVSAETRQGAVSTLDALQLGAVDFITKPHEDNAHVSTEILAGELRRLITVIRLRKEARQRQQQRQSGSIKMATACPQPQAASSTSVDARQPQVVVLGASTGGPTALPVLMGALPKDLGVPILLVQHMPPLFTASLADSLNGKCALRVLEGHNGQAVVPAHAYIAPGGKQMKVKSSFDKVVRLVVSDDPPENHCRPSVDTLFRSVAEVYGGDVVAVILTGMGNDGVAGLRSLKGRGATVIAQDEATCTVFGMPQEAIRASVVDWVLPLDRIASAIVAAVRSNGK